MSLNRPQTLLDWLHCTGVKARPKFLVINSRSLRLSLRCLDSCRVKSTSHVAHVPEPCTRLHWMMMMLNQSGIQLWQFCQQWARDVMVTTLFALQSLLFLSEVC